MPSFFDVMGQIMWSKLTVDATRVYCLIVALFVLSESCAAWSSSGNNRTFATPSTTNNTFGKKNIITSSCHRREALQSLTTALTVSWFPFIPTSAYADVTNKIASTTALKSLTRVQSQLPIKLLPLAQSNNYRGVRTALREPPFDTVRKDMLTLVRGGEDGPKAEILRLAYSHLIRSFEAIDTTSSLGMQGRTKGIDPFTLIIEYDDIVKSMELIIKVGGDAANIPLMDDSMQTEVGSIDVRSGKFTERVI